MNTTKEIINALQSFSSENRKKSSLRFFKTEKGDYGEGDQFRGVAVPDQRKIAKIHHPHASKETIVALLESVFHEDRLTGIFILIHKFNEGVKKGKGKEWVDLYLSKIDRINNWDLVDSSAYSILGKWLEDKDRNILYKFVKDSSLWKNRIAIVATKHFIKKNDFKDLFLLCEQLLHHKHDLIHKASGWMLREAWQVNPQPIHDFLDRHASYMPRTMLRYTIEKMNEKDRKKYLQSK
jgi:hypothetical protein